MYQARTVCGHVYECLMYRFRLCIPFFQWILKLFRQCGGFFVHSIMHIDCYQDEWNIVESGVKHHNPIPKILAMKDFSRFIVNVTISISFLVCSNIWHFWFQAVSVQVNGFVTTFNISSVISWNYFHGYIPSASFIDWWNRNNWRKTPICCYGMDKLHLKVEATTPQKVL